MKAHRPGVGAPHRASVALERTRLPESPDRALFAAVRAASAARSYPRYAAFLDEALGGGRAPYPLTSTRLLGADAYVAVKRATELFLDTAPGAPTMIDPIWAHWLAEGMLVRTLSAITERFINRRSRAGPDPLTGLELDPLRPLAAILWGLLQDDDGSRRGAIWSKLRRRGAWRAILDPFHDVLRAALRFYQDDDDTTRHADAFPLLAALKELDLASGPFEDDWSVGPPRSARRDLLIVEWILSRPELREFLGTRASTAHPEPWMDRVEAMKTLLGWGGANIIHHRDLAVLGEQLLLSLRLVSWSDVIHSERAASWARAFRPEVQGYLHALRAVSGEGAPAAKRPSPRLRTFSPRGEARFGAEERAIRDPRLASEVQWDARQDHRSFWTRKG